MQFRLINLLLASHRSAEAMKAPCARALEIMTMANQGKHGFNGIKTLKSAFHLSSFFPLKLDAIDRLHCTGLPTIACLYTTHEEMMKEGGGSDLRTCI